MLFRGPMGGGAASGAIGSMIASHCAQGQYLKSRVKPTNPGSVFQAALRNALRQLAPMWATGLTSMQRDAWATYAANVTWLNRLGDTVHLSGQMEFLRSNWPRIQNGLAIQPDAPITFDRGSIGPAPTLTLTQASMTATLTYDTAGAWIDNDPQSALLIYVGIPRSQGVTFFRRRTNVADLIRADNATTGSFTFQLPRVPAGPLQGWPAWVVATNADGRLTTPMPLAPVYTGPPPPGPWSDDFTYPNGDLTGNDGWTLASGFVDSIQVTSGHLSMPSGLFGSNTVTNARLPLNWLIPWNFTCTLTFTTGDDSGCETTLDFGALDGSNVDVIIQRFAGDGALNQISNCRITDDNGHDSGSILATGVTDGPHTITIAWDGTNLTLDIDATNVITLPAAPINHGQEMTVELDNDGGTDNLTLDDFRLGQP